MAGERLDFDIFARLREDGFAKAAKAAQGTSGEVVKLAEHLDKLGAKSTEIRMGLKGDKESLARLDKLQLKMVQVGEQLIDPEIDLKGTAKALGELSALDAAVSKLDKTSAGATTSVGSGGLAGPAGMGALIAAGAALSPILTSIAFGVGGFGLAAAGAVGPVVKAAQATGGLQANMAKLNPEQQKLGQSILGLGKQYHAFSKSLEPQVLSVFGKAIQTAGHLMHDVQPIAAATGKALDTMLGAIDAEFQSGTWQNFFGFMARTVGPDIQLVTKNFTDLMELLPGLLMDLQPVGTALLTVSDNLLKVAAAASKGFGGLTSVNNAASDTPKHANAGSQAWHFWEKAVRGAEDATAKLFDLIPGLNNQTGKTAKAIGSVGSQATVATQPVFNLTAALTGLTTAMQKNTDQLLTSQGDLIGWRQAQQAAEKQLESNSAGLRGNSKDVLANKAALLQSTQQAQAFAEQQTHVGGNLAAASRVIQDQIHWLQVHGEHSKFATAEIHALRIEEQKLHDIRQQIKVNASGTWQVLPGGTRTTHPGPVSGNPGGAPAARGAYIRTGQPGVDDQLIMAQRGELVVPTAIVQAGLTDHLRGMIPGFAAGGVVSNYAGSVGGMSPWLAREDAATLRAVEVATAAATAAGIKSAQSAAAGGFGGIGSGGSGTNVQIGQQMAASIGWTGNNWLFLKAGWNEESGWRTNAFNVPGDYSHAYGIPQAYPGTKMAAAGADWKTNPHTQIRWGLGYIRGTYGSPTGVPLWSANGPLPGYKGYADGGVVGDAKHPQDPQRKKWLAQLARDVRVLESDQKHAVTRRTSLRHLVDVGQLWFLTHPHVSTKSKMYAEHLRGLRQAEAVLRHFNKTEGDKEKVLAKKIALLRDLTGFPRGAKYGGPGSPDPGGGDTGAGGGDGGAGGGTTSAPTGPPPIPPPPMPPWMVAAGLGGSAAPTGGFTFPGQTGGGMAMPEPITPRYYGGPRSMGGYGGSGMDLGAIIAELRAMHQGIVGAVSMVAPGTARGFDRSMTGMSARVAGRFT